MALCGSEDSQDLGDRWQGFLLRWLVRYAPGESRAGSPLQHTLIIEGQVQRQQTSPASSSRVRSPIVTRRPRPAGSRRLIGRAVDGTRAGERHRRRRTLRRHRWRPLRCRDLRSGDGRCGRDLVEQTLRHGGVDLAVSADPNIGGGRQIHNVVAGERLSSESAQPPRELLHVNHLQPHPRIAFDPP